MKRSNKTSATIACGLLVSSTVVTGQLTGVVVLDIFMIFVEVSGSKTIFF